MFTNTNGQYLKGENAFIASIYRFTQNKTTDKLDFDDYYINM